MSREPDPEMQYKVGYKNPPKEHRIKPGERRNPMGRPRKVKPEATAPAVNLDRIITEEFGRLVPQKDGTQIELARRIVQDVALAAAKGKVPSQRMSLAELRRVQQRERDEEDDVLRLAYEYRHQGLAIFAEHRRHGLEPPDIIPHPAHIIIDGRNVKIAGPIDHDGRAWWERLKHIVKMLTKDLAYARQTVRDFPGEDWAEDRLKMAQRFRRKVMRLVPKSWNWREEIWTRDSETREKREAARLIRKYQLEGKQRD